MLYITFVSAFGVFALPVFLLWGVLKWLSSRGSR